MTYSHFEQKQVLEHVVQKRAEGIVSLSEPHGLEIPGQLSSGADAARETAVLLFLFWLLLFVIKTPNAVIMQLMLAFSCGWLIWKTGRSAWLGWFRLEKLHRIIEQEKFEIEHHREQEREELTALYRVKGFEGKLLDDVIQVLMADNDRLLNIMLEEELGLTLQAYEHPLKQGVGALFGVLYALSVFFLCYFVFSSFGMLIALFCVLGSSALVSARWENNRVIAALIWNCAIGALAVGVVYFVTKFFL